MFGACVCMCVCVCVCVCVCACGEREGSIDGRGLLVLIHWWGGAITHHTRLWGRLGTQTHGDHFPGLEILGRTRDKSPLLNFALRLFWLCNMLPSWWASPDAEG